MLDTLISSRTRIKLLLRLFLNPESSAYLRGLSEEFGESTNSIRLELNRFEEAGMLTSLNHGNKKFYRANLAHPLYPDIHNLLLKHVGIDQLVDNVIQRLGKVLQIYLTGDYAQGQDSGVIDLVLVGEINKNYLMALVEKAEKLSGRKVRFLTYEATEWQEAHHKSLDREKFLLLWERVEDGSR